MTTALRSFGLVMAVAAMLLRGLLPAGWMPSPAAGAPLVICTGQGPLHAAPSGSQRHNLPNHGPDVCPFASAAHLSLPLAALPASFATVVAMDVSPPPIASHIAPIGPYRPQSPRAPPLFA